MLSRSDSMNKTPIEIEKQIVADYLENFGTAELAKNIIYIEQQFSVFLKIIISL